MPSTKYDDVKEWEVHGLCTFPRLCKFKLETVVKGTYRCALPVRGCKAEVFPEETTDVKPMEPPDENRCQAEHLEGSFMTLGPRSMIRCSSPARWIATERIPGKDGRRGSMSVCDHCKDVLVTQQGEGYATFEMIIRKATTT